MCSSEQKKCFCQEKSGHSMRLPNVKLITTTQPCILMYCNQPNHITHRVNNTCKWDREGVLKSRQMENNEVMQKCGPKFWQNSNFRVLSPCNPAHWV